MVLFKDACVLHIVSSRQTVIVFVFLLIPNFHIRKSEWGGGGRWSELSSTTGSRCCNALTYTRADQTPV